MVGDICGRPGRAYLREQLPALRRREAADIVVVNGENAAAGFGITPSVYEEILAAGADVVTLGNHAFDKKEALALVDQEPRLLRPLNYPPGTPGRGAVVVHTPSGRLLVMNAMGRVFQPILVDDPFRGVDRQLEELAGRFDVALLVFHGEATSEKQAMGWHLDGRVAAVVGTHTHVQTADERILPQGTAYLTDVGMTGPADSVLGMDREAMVQRFLRSLPTRFEVAEGRRQLNAVLVDVEDESGHAREVRRIFIRE